MRETTYEDSHGRFFKVLLPDDAPDSQAKHGVIVGPPLLDSLELPAVIKTRLHNELFGRGIFTAEQALQRVAEVNNAIRAALRVTTESVLEIYTNG